MSQENCTVSFVGQKISKICWSLNKNGTQSATQFITGSWDDEKNLLSTWKLPTEASDNTSDLEPSVTSSLSMTGSINDIVYLNPTKILCCTSTGDVSMVTIDNHDGDMSLIQQWQQIHSYGATSEAASCTCIAVSDEEIITGGEDGRINFLYADRQKPIRIIENADSSNITGIQFLSSSEIVSVNTTGQLKLWDIRQRLHDKPEKVLTLTGNACPLLCVDKHPNQPHIVVTGHGDGVIGIWDIRQEKSPVTLIDAHEGEVWQVKFHHMYPDNLFTCSQDGSCWFWDGTSMISGANYIKSMNEASGRYNSTQMTNGVSSSVWLYVDANKHKMETFSLLPFSKNSVNSFDVNGSTLICGTDNEALIIVNDIPVH